MRIGKEVKAFGPVRCSERLNDDSRSAAEADLVLANAEREPTPVVNIERGSLAGCSRYAQRLYWPPLVG